MKAHDNGITNRQEIRRAARRAPLTRCAICGKVSTRCNRKVHALVEARALKAAP